MVRGHKCQEIDLQASYPCPVCRWQGRLSPIALTEAFGCDRCQQIFVLHNQRQSIEQLSSVYPYKRSWHWTGQHWKNTHIAWPRHWNWLPLLLMILPLLLVGIWLVLR